jgi:hypothetical protein
MSTKKSSLSNSESTNQKESTNNIIAEFLPDPIREAMLDLPRT